MVLLTSRDTTDEEGCIIRAMRGINKPINLELMLIHLSVDMLLLKFSRRTAASWFGKPAVGSVFKRLSLCLLGRTREKA